MLILVDAHNLHNVVTIFIQMYNLRERRARVYDSSYLLIVLSSQVPAPSTNRSSILW